MCGRFVGFSSLEQLKHHFPIDDVKCEAVANYNVAPAQEILAIAQVDGLNVLDKYHWGLVPFWAKDTKIGNKMINARSETVSQKPSFREAFKKRRCLILADGFYEWIGQKGKKQPLFITPPDKLPFAFAGLWESWPNNKQQDEIYKSCTIITRESVGVVKKIHHRMPVILIPDIYGSWLDPDIGDQELLSDMLRHKAVTDLIYHPVSNRVNSVQNSDPSNLSPIQTEFDF